MINEAKKRSFLITAEGVVRAASLSLADNENAYDEYFRENEYITFKFSASEGKEGESIDIINGEKIKLSFEGKSPIGGEVNLYKNGDVEVINLTDGTFYVNKDVDTELAVTENSGSLTRKELQTLVEQLQEELEEVKEKNESQDVKDQEIENKNKEQDSKIKENADNIASNTTNITNLTTTVNNINKNMLAKTYPVGSIYISTSSTNPGTIFGGIIMVQLM